MKTASPTHRAPRASCRVVCSIAVLLVTLGGLRLLGADEPTTLAVAAPVEVAAVPRTAQPPIRRSARHDFAATVEHASRRIECAPEGCGFPRVQTLDVRALDWTALEQRVSTSTRSTSETATIPAQPRSWVPGSLCELGCAEALRAPDALTTRF